MNHTFFSSVYISLLLGLFFTPEPVFAKHEYDLENAATFLQNQYNQTLQLCAEAPSVAPDKYWLWEDNYLAYEALKYYNETMSNEIYNKLESYGYMKNYAYEALFKQTIELPFKAVQSYTVEEGTGYTIKLDMYNGSTFSDWENYANLLCLAALSEYWRCWYDNQAIIYFNKAAAMWDGTGIIDETNNEPEDEEYSKYNTYKLVLLLYAERILGQNLSLHNKAENTIWQLQNSSNYGIHTHYNNSIDPMDSDVNVETTSLVIGLYKWPEVYSKSIVGPVCEVGNNLVEIMIVSALLTSVSGYLLWESRRRR